jgi:hypothetical protein
MMGPVFAVHKIVDDFQVNENVGTSRYRSAPAMAGDRAGNAIFTWQDYRNDLDEIFFQRYRSLNTAIGNNTKVNEAATPTFYERGTAAAMNESGQFCIVWRNGQDINFQKSNAEGPDVNGNLSGELVAVDNYVEKPCIAMDANGGFVIAWLKKFVYFQRFDQNGVPRSKITCVNPDPVVTRYGYYTAMAHVDIAMDSKGNFTIIWTDFRNGPDPDVFCQRYSSSDQPLGSAFRVNDIVDSNQLNGVIAYDADDNFVIAWMDDRSGRYAIWAQRYNRYGMSSGRNFRIGVNSIDHVQRYPSISRRSSGEFVIVWLDVFGKDFSILGQYYTADGIPQGAVFDVTGKKEDWMLTGYNQVKLDDGGLFKVAWMEQRDGCWGIYYKAYNINRDVLVSDTRVNDDIGGNPQTRPSIAMDNNGGFTIVWEDCRNSYERLWCQSYNRFGLSVNNAFRITFNSQHIDDRYPIAAMVDDDRLSVLWQGCSKSEFAFCDYLMQVIRTDGTAVAPIWTIGNSTDDAAIAGSGNGCFVYTWLDKNLKKNVMCQRFDSLDQAIGEKVQVNDGTAAFSCSSPLVTMNGKGEYIIFWRDPGTGKSTLRFQRFDPDGRAVGKNTIVSDQQIGLSKRSVAMNDDGYFIVAWVKYNNSNFLDIFYQRFAPDGTELEKNVQVNDNPPRTQISNPAVAMAENGDFVFVWDDKRHGATNSDIYCQRYRADGTPVGTNFRVNGDNTTSAQTNPDVAFKSDIIVTTWQTHHNEGQSWDVYANLIQFSEETAVDDNRSDIPESFELLQNYPNPFNAQTTIIFTMPTAGKANLTVYNLLGQKVAVLLNGVVTAGWHRILWDASNMKSGVYICQMIAGYKKSSNKMTIIR